MRLLFIFVALTCLLSQGLNAQKNILISGYIQDRKHNPIPQSLVTIEGSTNSVYSDNTGYYALEILPGNYVFNISAFGFKEHKTSIDVKNNQKLNFTLEEQAVNLLTVEVHGKSKSQQLREGAFTVNSLDVKHQISSLNNLNALVGRSSGIKIREDGGVGADFDLSINGLSGNSIKYFIDGVPLASLGNGVSLGNIPVNIVDRIDIYKGAVPIELGTDALGGAVNIITKKSTRNYLDFSAGFGSFNTYKTDLNAQYVDKKTGVFFRPYIGVNYSKNNYTMKNVEVWDASISEFKRVDVKRFHDDYFSLISQLSIGVTNKKWADLLSLSLSFSSVDNELQTGSVQSIVYGEAKRKNTSYNVSGQYLKRDFLIDGLSTDLYLSHTWDNTTVIDTTFRKYKWDGSYSEASRNEITGRGRSIRKTKRPLTVARANFRYVLNEVNSFNLNYLLEYVANNRTDDVDVDFTPSKDIFSKHITSLSYNQSFWDDKWVNTFFVKDYLSHLKIGQNDLSWITGSTQREEGATSNNWGYGFSSRFRIASWLAVKGSFEHTVRLPLAREVLGNTTTVYPNFTLNPENSNNINIGLFGTVNIAPKHSLYYEATMFQRDVKDYIRLVITESEGMSQYANVSSVSVKGVEGEVRYSYNNFFQAIANISYLDEKNKTKFQDNGKPEITYNNRMPNRPWLYGNLEFNCRFKNVFGIKDNQLRLAYYLQYVHWFYLTWEGYASLSSKSTIPTQYLNNMQLTYSLKKDKYNVALECNNIFDRITYDNYMMQKPGRAFFCKFRLFFN